MDDYRHLIMRFDGNEFRLNFFWKKEHRYPYEMTWI